MGGTALPIKCATVQSPSSPPQPPPPPLAPWAVYCNSPACGDALLAAGWRVLGEWGTLARFGAPPILSHADFLEQGWTVAPGMSGASDTSPQSDALQWKRYSGRGGYVIPLPQGTTDIVAAYAGYEHTCNLRLYAANGTELYFEPRNEGATSGVPAPAVLSIDPSWHSGGPALLQFDESSDWCYTMYVLVRGNWPPSSPPQPASPPALPPPPPSAPTRSPLEFSYSYPRGNVPSDPNLNKLNDGVAGTSACSSQPQICPFLHTPTGLPTLTLVAVLPPFALISMFMRMPRVTVPRGSKACRQPLRSTRAARPPRPRGGGAADRHLHRAEGLFQIFLGHEHTARSCRLLWRREHLGSSLQCGSELRLLSRMGRFYGQRLVRRVSKLNRILRHEPLGCCAIRPTRRAQTAHKYPRPR